MAIAVIVNGGNNGIEPMATIAGLLTVAAVDGSGNNGIFTSSYYDNDRKPCPHCPCPCCLSDKDHTVGWRACRDASHSLLPWSLSLASFLSPLMG